MTAKDDVLAALRKSIEYAAGAVRSLASPALEEEIDAFGFPASRRAYVLILLTHDHEHLGQAIAYARSVGVTPPWSEARGDAAIRELFFRVPPGRPGGDRRRSAGRRSSR